MAMGLEAYITAGFALGVLTALCLAWRRILFAPFRIRLPQMTVSQLRLAVRAGADEARVNTILAAFAGGFNQALVARRLSAAGSYCRSVSSLYRPFAEEGVAMAYVPRRLFRFDPTDFEQRLVKRRPQFRYLYYVGLGFWAGIRNTPPQKLSRMTAPLDPLHRYLCFDGYGFARAFFHYRQRPEVLQRLDLLEGYARNAAYHGVGRALYFLYMADAEQLTAHLENLGPFAVDGAAGVGLAAAFVNPDRLEVARALAARLPQALRPHVHLGLCFGLKARSINDLDKFQEDMAGVDEDVRQAVFASIRECDRIELQIRADGMPDGYRRWREGVTAWMTENVVYPLSRMGRAEDVQAPRSSVHARSS